MANKIQVKMIDDILKYYYLLDNWELGFIESLKKRTEDVTFELSKNQNSKLNKINTKLVEIGI